MKKYWFPAMILAVFETVAVTLTLTKHNLFYLFNFSYIGISLALGLVLFIRQSKHARRVTQLLVGLYMLVLSVHRRSRGGHHSLCRCENFRAAAVWPGLVRLCLLDGHGA